MNISLSSGNDSTTLSNSTMELLEYYICGCVDFPRSGIDCSQRELGRCFKCTYLVVYFSGESINDYDSIGHLTCRIIAIFTIIIAILGIISNSLVVMVVGKRSGKHSFDFLLRALAHVDNFCCFSCIIYCCSHIAYYDNLWGRGQGILYWLYFSSTTVLLSRVMSMYLTLVITIERYIAIAFPLQSRIWFSLEKTKLQMVLGSCLMFLVILPGYFRVYVGPNIYGDQEGGLDVPSLRDYDYMFLPTRFYSFSAGVGNAIVIFVLQYWIPIPALLVLNWLTYRKVKVLSRERQHLSASPQKELQPAVMFMPVVVVFLCTNIWPLGMLITMRGWGFTYREMWMTCILATAVNSSVNFLIYYHRGTAFRQETKLFVTRLFYSLSRVNSHLENLL